MFLQPLAFLAISIQATLSVAGPLAGPTVQLDGGTFTGTTLGKVSKFLGIPYAKPP